MALRGFVKCLADGHHCANIMLAAGFCERWPKAWLGGFALVLDYGKKLAAKAEGRGIENKSFDLLALDIA